MLLALVPALGAMAYAGSDTMVKNGLGRMLLDQSAHKVPFGLYERLGLARITAPRATEMGGTDAVDGVSVSSAQVVAEPALVGLGD